MAREAGPRFSVAGPAGGLSATYEITEPVVISQWPAISIDQGQVRFDATVKASTLIATALADAVSPGHLQVEGAHIVVGEESGPSGDESETLQSLFARVVAGGASALTLRDSTVDLVLPGGHRITLADFQGEFSLTGGRLGLIGKGGFRVGGEALSYEAATGAVIEADGLPLTLHLGGKNASATFDGHVAVENGFSQTGRLNLNVVDLRKFADALGFQLPGKRGLRGLRAVGDVTLAGGLLSLEEATIALDGNEATGQWSLGWSGQRPLLDATLAYRSFDLGPYIGAWSGDRATASALRAVRLDAPLLKAIDADLRLSASTVSAGPLATGRAAIAFTVRSGGVIADIAELELYGGSAEGQIRFDPDQEPARLSLRTTLSGVNLARMIGPVLPGAAVSGALDCTLDVAAAGGTLGKALADLTGEAEFSLQGGRLPVDVAMLVRTLQAGTVLDLQSTRGPGQSFRALSGKFDLAHGVASARQLSLEADDTALTASGDVNLAEQSAQLRLSILPADGAETGAALAGVAKPAYLRGPWSALTLSSGGERDEMRGGDAVPRPPMAEGLVNGPG